MAMNKRKTTTGIVAGVTAVALLLGGTFAWTSISQQAKNETAGIVNVGGRLHDDFDGENKDVYVENFTDPLNGGQPIYARIKLTEYMEVGQDAGGGADVDVDGDGKIEAVPVVSGTSIDDKDNWPVHIPAELCTTCNTGGTCKIHDHWTWTMGGQTTFMPTFNKDKDSLAADINGTYHGTDDTDKIYYDDYVTYITEGGIVVNVNDNTATNADGTAITITGDDVLTEVTGDVTTVTGNAYYDDDADHETNDHEQNIGGFKTEPETHYAKKTVDGTVITMAEWLQNPVAGNFWVYDTDGWAYWANPIMPGEATGLLLDGIEMTKNPGEKCYYAINVVAEFATVGDWEYFTGIDEEENANALELLKAASENVTTVTVTNLGSATLYTNPEEGQPNTTTFTATVSKAGTSAADTSTFEWVVYDADHNVIDRPIPDENGVVTVLVDSTITSESLIVAAKDTASGAIGVSAVAVEVEMIDYSIYTDNNPITENQTFTLYVTWNDDYAQVTSVPMTVCDPEAVEFSSEIVWELDTTVASIEGSGLYSDALSMSGSSLTYDSTRLIPPSSGTISGVKIIAKDSNGNELASVTVNISISRT